LRRWSLFAEWGGGGECPCSIPDVCGSHCNRRNRIAARAVGAAPRRLAHGPALAAKRRSTSKMDRPRSSQQTNSPSIRQERTLRWFSTTRGKRFAQSWPLRVSRRMPTGSRRAKTDSRRGLFSRLLKLTPSSAVVSEQFMRPEQKAASMRFARPRPAPGASPKPPSSESRCCRRSIGNRNRSRR
jgi:hypothetical protein